MTETPGCEAVRELLPELAAGVVSGEERARALAHLASCPECRRELDEVTAVLDGLVLLAPAREPAPGFESAVLARLSTDPDRAGRRAWLMAAAASVVVAALAAGLVWWQTADDRAVADQYRHTLAVADGRYLAAADLNTAAEPSVGHAFAYEGDPSWIYLTIGSAPASGEYDVRLVTTDDRVLDIGRCQIRAGRGAWGGVIEVPVHEIRQIQLLRSGVATMSATFHDAS